MQSYNFALSAENDLADIVDYTIRKWGADQASKYIDGLEQQTQLLAENPILAKPVDQLFKGLRAFPYQRHTIYFVEVSHGITISRVLHKSMDPKLHI